ncbi:MAG: hypothetical protein FJ267_15435 [Planctomycetes bacterium]|nr:hypothetical protein [Planctomycetota bacterium]
MLRPFTHQVLIQLGFVFSIGIFGPNVVTAEVFQSEKTSFLESLDSLPVPRLKLPAVFGLPRSSQPPVIRGQDSSTLETPPLNAPSTPSAVPYGVPSNSYGVQSNLDPFLYGPDPVLGQQSPTVLSGVNGPQPYRQGFTPRFDYQYFGKAGTSDPNVGQFHSQSLDLELSYMTPLGPGWAFTSTPQFGGRLWEGPELIDLPGSVYRFGWDFQFAMPLDGPWSMQADFNPSINSDLESSLKSEAFNFDGNVMLFYRTNPQWMFVVGAGYWDRVDSIFLPYAGVVWNPNDLWEFRLLFPKGRISYFLGNIRNASHWLYASSEFHVESYQIDMPGVSSHQQVQVRDWRLGLGLRSDHGWYDKSVEVAYVFHRDVEFRRVTPDFEINDTFMVRCAIRF